MKRVLAAASSIGLTGEEAVFKLQYPINAEYCPEFFVGVHRDISLEILRPKSVRKRERWAEEWQPLRDPTNQDSTLKWVEFYRACRVRLRFYWGTNWGRPAPKEEEASALKKSLRRSFRTI